MFKGLGNLGNLTNMLKTAQEMGGKMEAINAELKAKRIEGSAGGGMVTVEVNGLGEVLKLVIEPSLVEKNEVGMIEDLVPAAINQAAAKAKQEHAELMKGWPRASTFPALVTPSQNSRAPANLNRPRSLRDGGWIVRSGSC